MGRKLVREAIDGATDTGKLEHFLSHGGSPYRVTQRMLDAITPVLHKIPKSELKHGLAFVAMRNGFVDWIRNHLLALLPKESMSPGWMDAGDAMSALDETVGAVALGRDAVWRTRGFAKLAFPAEPLYLDIPSVLKAWLGSEPG